MLLINNFNIDDLSKWKNKLICIFRFGRYMLGIDFVFSSISIDTARNYYKKTTLIVYFVYFARDITYILI